MHKKGVYFIKKNKKINNSFINLQDNTSESVLLIKICCKNCILLLKKYMNILLNCGLIFLVA